MDKFLEVVYNTQLEVIGNKDMFMEIFEPFTDKLKSLLSEELYEEIEETFIDCAVENNRFYGIVGMKLAIGIMNGTYIPVV